MRFAVGDRFGHWAPTWKLWLDGQDRRCVHIGCRSLGGHFSFVRRDPGVWCHRFTEGSAGHDRPASAVGVRVSCPATAAPSPERGLVELMRIRTDACAVREPTVRGRYRYVARVPIHPGKANEIRVLVVDCGTATKGWPAEALVGTVPLGTLEVTPDLRILVVYRSVRSIGVVAAQGPSARASQGVVPAEALSA